MPEVDSCLNAYFYLSQEGGGWAVMVQTVEKAVIEHPPFPSFYWESGKQAPPTQEERARVLRRLGYEVVDPWEWRETSQQPQVHSLYAMAHVRALAAAAPAAADAEAVSA